jgi:hypothetical protein
MLEYRVILFESYIYHNFEAFLFSRLLIVSHIILVRILHLQ